MDERSGRAAGGRAERDFERLLLAEIETGAVDFPKGLIVPEGRSALARLAQAARQLFLSPALAYGILVGVLLVFVARRPQPETRVSLPAPVPAVSEGPPRVGTAPILQLGSGPTRDGGAAARLALDPAHAFVVVSFLIPIRSDPSVVYRAQIADAAGRLVASEPRLRSTDALGNFVLVVPRTLLPSGDYLLTVSGPGEAHRFPFVIQRSEESAP